MHDVFDPNEVTYEVLGLVFALGRKKKNDLTRRENRSGEKTTQFKILRRAMFLKVGLRPPPETRSGAAAHSKTKASVPPRWLYTLHFFFPQ